MTDRPRRRPDETPSADDPWPPNFPHAAIDALLERVQSASAADTGPAVELLALIAREAQRLRSTVLRLSTARLATAEQEARVIVEEAHRHADDVRALALATLDERLDEGDRLIAAVRETIRMERRIAGLTSDRPDPRSAG